jgi:deoxyribodipyrimidine photo-lyase
VIGEDYPYPVVEYEAARERAVDRYEAVRPRAQAALEVPEVARRASLSGMSEPPDGQERDATRAIGGDERGSEPRQESLSAFDDGAG